MPHFNDKGQYINKAGKVAPAPPGKKPRGRKPGRRKAAVKGGERRAPPAPAGAF